MSDEFNSALSTHQILYLIMSQKIKILAPTTALLSHIETDADYHEQEKIINQLRMRVAVLEQEIKDKEQVLTKSSDLLGAEQEKKVLLFKYV